MKKVYFEYSPILSPIKDEASFPETPHKMDKSNVAVIPFGSKKAMNSTLCANGRNAVRIIIMTISGQFNNRGKIFLYPRKAPMKKKRPPSVEKIEQSNCTQILYKQSPHIKLWGNMRPI